MVVLIVTAVTTMERDRINALSAESGFPPGPIEKVIRLGEVAALVARHAQIVDGVEVLPLADFLALLP
jgi:hypothetical protein